MLAKLRLNDDYFLMVMSVYIKTVSREEMKLSFINSAAEQDKG